jgi:hypothetical protein
MGEGYTAAQHSQFDVDALDVANNFFSITPYFEYRNYANVIGLFTASAQSGADQPPYNASCTQYARVQTCCGDPDANGVTPTTVFDGVRRHVLLLQHPAAGHRRCVADLRGGGRRARLG